MEFYNKKEICFRKSDTRFHNASSYPNGATNGVVNGTPSAAGTYYYQCSAHNGMYGTITVQ